MNITVGNVARGDAFFDREKERERLWKYLEREHVLLVGPRRLGKTSLLQRMVDEADEKGFYGKLVDMEHGTSIEDFLDALDNAFPEEGITAFFKKKGKEFMDNLPKVKKIEGKIAGTGGSLEFDEKAAPLWTQKAHALKNRLSDRPLLICLDEISVFLGKLLQKNREDGELLIAWLRKWRQEKEISCRFIFSGSIGLNAFLIKQKLQTYFADCADFKLGPFTKKIAIEMLSAETKSEGWDVEKDALDSLCAHIGWLSPFYLNLMLDEAIHAAEERVIEMEEKEKILKESDVKTAYERLLARPSRFIYWYQRLEHSLSEPELTFAKAILGFVSRSKRGSLKRSELGSRLHRLESIPDKRRERIHEALIFLEEEGYLTYEEPISFLSFLLRDYWKKNHA